MEGITLTDSKIQSWDEPKSLAEFANEAARDASGGVLCPGCGRKLFVNKTETGKTRILRYEECRTCQRKFRTKQPHKIIIEEIKPNDISSSGKPGIAASE